MVLQEKQRRPGAYYAQESLHIKKVRNQLLNCIKDLVDEVVLFGDDIKEFQTPVISKERHVHAMLQDHSNAVAIASDERVKSLYYDSSSEPPQLIITLQ